MIAAVGGAPGRLVDIGDQHAARRRRRAPARRPGRCPCRAGDERHASVESCSAMSFALELRWRLSRKASMPSWPSVGAVEPEAAPPARRRVPSAAPRRRLAGPAASSRSAPAARASACRAPCRARSPSAPRARRAPRRGRAAWARSPRDAAGGEQDVGGDVPARARGSAAGCRRRRARGRAGPRAGRAGRWSAQTMTSQQSAISKPPPSA